MARRQQRAMQFAAASSAAVAAESRVRHGLRSRQVQFATEFRTLVRQSPDSACKVAVKLSLTVFSSRCAYGAQPFVQKHLEKPAKMGGEHLRKL